MSFLTVFEDWVDRSFARIFSFGRRFALEDVAQDLMKSIRDLGQDGMSCRYRVLFNPGDFRRLGVTPRTASIHLQSALANLAKVRGVPVGGVGIDVVVSDQVLKGEWMVEPALAKPVQCSPTVVIQPKIKSYRLPRFLLNKEQFILDVQEKYSRTHELPQGVNVISKQKISIGRCVAGKKIFDISIDDKFVTRRKAHAFVIVSGENITIIDNDSTNGLFVNQCNVSKHVLIDGDEIMLGRSVMKFEWVSVDDEI